MRRQQRPKSESFYDYVIGSERWARFRDRILRTRGRRCERCGVEQTVCELELHHLTYERLGFEQDNDVQVVCRPCHYKADKEREAKNQQRAQQALYMARLDGWATRRYGEDWNDTRCCEDVEEEFNEWLERRGDDD